ncbi:MAG: efflux RND transporter periplasmic adaptor subunit [Deltaproteobacteria bacterium]|jgi:RND family efflux transporter MFP subunit|nr:efflux RND transporter periplasmic adaptor subunit [Deltaproteobacteria bacterium]
MRNFQKSSVWILAAFFVLCLGMVPALSLEVEYDGIIEPHVVVELGSPAQGIVAKVNVDRSSMIKKGQTLVELESSVERAAVAKASSMATFDGEIALQKAQLAFAKRVHGRVKNINAITAHDKDQAATDVALTGFRLKKAREDSTLAKLELKKAKALLNLRVVKSPISGVVVDRYVSPGEFVNSQPLLRVAQIDPLRVEVIVPAQMFGKISPDMTATIVPELPMYAEQTATVTLVDKVIDAASSTFGVRLELPNSDYQLPSGLRCRVRFEINENDDEVK